MSWLYPLFLIACAASTRQAEQECTSKYGWKGICKSSLECLSLGSLVSQGYDPELCESNAPIVCCPPLTQQQNNLITSYSQAQAAYSQPQATYSASQASYNLGHGAYSPGHAVYSHPQTTYTQAAYTQAAYTQAHPAYSPAYASSNGYLPTRSRNTVSSFGKKKRKRQPGAYIRTRIQDDENTLVKIRPIRKGPKRNKRRPRPTHMLSSTLKNDRKIARIQEMLHSANPSDLLVQDDQLYFSYDTPQGVSAKKCQEFAGFAWETISELSPSNGVVPVSQEFCPGDRKDSSVVDSELPFVVGLGYEDTREKIIWACSGTLISKEYVLTAAHCLHPPLGRPKVARLGSPQLDMRETGLEVGISEVILHPLYNPADRTADIALLKLAPLPSLGIRIRPACLHTNSSGVLLTPYWTIDPTVTLNLKSEEDGVRLLTDPDALTLRKSLAVEVDMYQCNTTATPENNICVRSIASDYCQSMTEGGEALIQTDQYNQCHYAVIGVAVDRACSSHDPSIFTSIAPFISWIENIVWS